MKSRDDRMTSVPPRGRSCEENADTTGFSRVVLQFQPTVRIDDARIPPTLVAWSFNLGLFYAAIR